MTGHAAQDDLIAELGRKYIWWTSVGDRPHSEDRILAQAMNVGTYDDILRLERTVGAMRLVEIMRRAQPGWLSDRSWEFWRGRLAYRTGECLPNDPLRRTFDAKTS